jgi:hypothetical protein
MIEKREDIIRVDMVKAEVDDVTPMTSGQVTKEQYKRIAVARYGARTESPRKREVL